MFSQIGALAHRWALCFLSLLSWAPPGLCLSGWERIGAPAPALSSTPTSVTDEGKSSHGPAPLKHVINPLCLDCINHDTTGTLIHALCSCLLQFVCVCVSCTVAALIVVMFAAPKWVWTRTWSSECQWVSLRQSDVQRQGLTWEQQQQQQQQ